MRNIPVLNAFAMYIQIVIYSYHGLSSKFESKSTYGGISSTTKKKEIDLSWFTNTINGDLLGDIDKPSGSEIHINA